MNDLVRLRRAATGGVIAGRDLVGAGCDANDVRRLVRSGELVRIRAGAFVDGALLAGAGPAESHRLRTAAVLRQLARSAAVDLSALVSWRLPVVAADLDLIHVAPVAGGRPRSDRVIRVHPVIDADDVATVEGVPVQRLVPAILQVAARSQRAGLIAADAALRSGLTSTQELRDHAERPGVSRSATLVASLASGLAESPGESWTRLVLAGLGIEADEQVVIRSPEGRFVGRVDFLLRSARVVVEFDGAVKYEGAEGRRALAEEKRREDELRALGYQVVRLTWRDLADPQRVLDLLRRAVERAA